MKEKRKKKGVTQGKSCLTVIQNLISKKSEKSSLDE